MSDYLIMPNFGANSVMTKEDSSKFSESSESNAVSSKTEGGYTITRARFRQARRRLFFTGFTNLTDDQKDQLQSFESSMGGTIQPFLYRHPLTNELILVQFVNELRFEYVGMKDNRRWNVHDIQLREV